MGLEMIMIAAVRTLGDFISARVVFSGYKNNSDFLRKNKVQAPTFYRLIEAEKPEDVRSYRSSLEAIATALRFPEWADLVKAYENNEPKAWLDIVPVNLPVEVYQRAAELAKKAKITPLQQIIKVLGPGINRVKSDPRRKAEAKR